MKPVDRGHRWADLRTIKDPVLAHQLASGATFLGRLKDEAHAPWQRRLLGDSCQNARGAEQDRGVSVVPAGVHLAVRPGGPGDTGQFVDRQGVHIRSERDRGALGAREMTEDSGATGQITDVLDARILQSGTNDLRGANLLEGKFGMGVQVMTEGDQIIEFFGDQ